MKIKHNYGLYKTFISTQKFLYKFRIVILFENAILKTAKYGLTINMQRLKTQIAAKSKMSVLIPNISK